MVPRRKIFRCKMNNSKSLAIQVGIPSSMVPWVTRFIPRMIWLSICLKHQVVGRHVCIYSILPKFYLATKDKISTMKHSIQSLLQFRWRFWNTMSSTCTVLVSKQMLFYLKTNLLSCFGRNRVTFMAVADSLAVRKRLFVALMTTAKCLSMFQRKFNSLMCFTNVFARLRRLYTSCTNLRPTNTTPRVMISTVL